MNGPLLLILPHNPGDVLMGLAALRRIKSARPDLPVDYVVGEECRDLVEGHPLLRRVHVIPRKHLLAPWKAGDVDGTLKVLQDFLASLSSITYGVSLNLFQERFGGLLHSFVQSPRKLGLHLAEARHYRVGSRFLEHLFAIPASRKDNAWHAVDIYVRAAREALEIPPSEKWPLPDAALPWLPPLRPPDGWNGPAARGYVAMHPGSAWPGKRWPESHWAALAGACLAAGRDVVFTGAPEERPVIDGIRSLMPAALSGKILDWVGRTSLSGAAWIHSNAGVTVAGDTVAMHLAAAAGTPTVSLFGPSNPVETGPYGRSVAGASGAAGPQGHFIFQTQIDLPSDLAFDRPHAGLSSLSPQTVARFLLEGKAPEAGGDDAALWETAWDSARDMQVLRNGRGRVHPHQANAPLMAKLDRPFPAASPEASRPALPGNREAVRRALETCLARGGAGDYRALEEADQRLGAETPDSVIWEAYRIAVNGLPTADLREHVALRKARFAQALDEEAAAGGAAR